MKEEIIKLLKSTNREGIDKVIEFMEKSDFLQHQQVQDFTEHMKVDLQHIVLKYMKY